MKKILRWHINLNDEPTVEIDYSGIHPNIAYHSKGLSLSGDDPYDIDGFDRGDVKTAFNTMINREGSKGRESAVQVLSRDLVLPIDEAKQLEQAIKELHSPIADKFNSGAGLALQKTDRNIALSVLESCVARSIPVIPIHDSFLVSVRHTETVKLMMYDAYIEEVYEEVSPNGSKGFKGFKGIKAEAREFTEAMNDAIYRCLDGDTEGMDGQYWDNLINNEPVQAPPKVEETCVDEYEE